MISFCSHLNISFFLKFCIWEIKKLFNLNLTAMIFEMNDRGTNDFRLIFAESRDLTRGRMRLRPPTRQRNLEKSTREGFSWQVPPYWHLPLWVLSYTSSSPFSSYITASWWWRLKGYKVTNRCQIPAIFKFWDFFQFFLPPRFLDLV